MSARAANVAVFLPAKHPALDDDSSGQAGLRVVRPISLLFSLVAEGALTTPFRELTRRIARCQEKTDVGKIREK
jgi:hypothetical protein